MKIGFVGLGLIGGSIAKAVRRVYPEARIIAYNRNQTVLVRAEQEGIVDESCWEITSAFADCDYIFLCIPVISTLPFLKELKNVIGQETILTDVGSTKKEIHEAVRNLGLENQFIGGHPMAGSEKSGFEYSSDRLIENAWYILTPGGDVSISRISGLSALVSSLGALPLILTPEEHDHITAAVSHVPHVISASLVNMVHDLDGREEYMRTIAAGGFKDITRISSSSPHMWQEICLANGEEICIVLDKYIRKLTDFRFAIRNGNGEKLLQYFTECKEYRDSFSEESSGPIKKEFRLYMDVTDKAGAIAEVAVILAREGISIRNIGIVHNRSFEQGVLRIEFYDEETCRHAASVLSSRNHRVYEV